MAYTLSPDLFEDLAYNVHNEEGQVVERIVSTLAGWTYQLRQGRGEYTPHYDTPQQAFTAYEGEAVVTNFNTRTQSNQLTLF